MIYIAPDGTLTGNANLVSSSLFNCGTVLSPKITMRQSSGNGQYVVENSGRMKCDSILLDSLGHFHNKDTLICAYLRMRSGSSFDNFWLTDARTILVETDSRLASSGKVKADVFDMKDMYSRFYNHYGTFSARKLFRVGTNTSVSGIIFICADSCFINNGAITSSAPVPWSPAIRVNGISENHGLIQNLDFCDLSSANDGEPDLNTGTLTAINYCATEVDFCDYTYTDAKRPPIEFQKLSIFPNPTKEHLHIQTENRVFEGSEIEIINDLGQRLLHVPFSEIISVEALPPGHYTLKILGKSGPVHARFIKL